MMFEESSGDVSILDFGESISLPLSVLGRNSLVAFFILTLFFFVLFFWLLSYWLAVVV
jgi:hypothetical protein